MSKSKPASSPIKQKVISLPNATNARPSSINFCQPFLRWKA